MLQELNKEFIGTGEVAGFKFTQLLKNENANLYKVETESNTHYEVFKSKQSPVCIDFELRLYSNVDFKETYPKANDFGNWAWTYFSLEKANKKFVELS